MPLHRAVQDSRIENLDVITAGPEVPNPAELLSSPRLAELLAEARKSYDIIVVDSSPLLAMADPEIIGAVVDGIILTVRAWMLDHRDAEQSVELLRNLGTPILGLLVNGINPRERDYSRRTAPVGTDPTTIWDRAGARIYLRRSRPGRSSSRMVNRNPARSLSRPWRHKVPVSIQRKTPRGSS